MPVAPGDHAEFSRYSQPDGYVPFPFPPTDAYLADAAEVAGSPVWRGGRLMTSQWRENSGTSEWDCLVQTDGGERCIGARMLIDATVKAQDIAGAAAK